MIFMMECNYLINIKDTAKYFEKVNFAVNSFKEDVYKRQPLWVADMDFATAPFVTDAIRKRCENEVLGYTGKPDSYYNAIINRCV